jgi:hypothetical protein
VLYAHIANILMNVKVIRRGKKGIRGQQAADSGGEMTQLQLIIFFWFGIGDSSHCLLKLPPIASPSSLFQIISKKVDVHAIMRFSFNSRVGSAVLAGKARKGRSFLISDCGMTNRGCLPARHREASAEADGPLRRGGRGKPLPQFG